LVFISLTIKLYRRFTNDTHTYIHTYTHTYIHTYTHTYALIIVTSMILGSLSSFNYVVDL